MIEFDINNQIILMILAIGLTPIVRVVWNKPKEIFQTIILVGLLTSIGASIWEGIASLTLGFNFIVSCLYSMTVCMIIEFIVIFFKKFKKGSFQPKTIQKEIKEFLKFTRSIGRK